MNPERFRRLKEVLERRQPDLTVLMEKVHKPHNLSAVLRNCDAVGVLEVHAVEPDDDLELHRVTSGSASKWIRVRTHRRTEEAIQGLKSRGFRVLAAHPDPDAVDYREANLTRPVAFLVGTELYGVTEEGLSLADGAVSIPMVGMVRSLNVSVAAALLLYEAYRQRSEAGMYQRSRLSPETYRRILFEWAYPEIARRRKKQGLPYPALSEDGEILDL